MCHNCKKQGHPARVCRSKPDDKRTHRLEGVVEETQFVGMYNVEGSDTKPYIVSLSLNDAPLKMEVVTGGTRTIMSEKTYRILWKGKKRPELSPTKVRLRTYSNRQLFVLGTLRINVKYEAQQVGFDVLVVKGAGPSLLGRGWLKKIQIHWSNVAFKLYQSQSYNLTEGNLGET